MVSIKNPKTLFIVVNPRPHWKKESTLIYFPTGLSEVVTSVVKKGYVCDLLDLQVNPKTEEELFAIFEDGRYDIVALGTLSNSYHIVKPLIRMIRQALPKTVIVVGNSVASAHPHLLLEKTDADIAVCGDGEDVILEIIDRLREGIPSFKGIEGIIHKYNGNIYTEKRRTAISNLDQKPFPELRFFDVETYIKSAENYDNQRAFSYVSNLRPFPINTTRGCPYRCTFCFNSKHYKYNPVRYSSAQNIVEKIWMLKEEYDVNFIWFWDEITFFSRKHAEPIIDLILKEKLNINFQAAVRVGFLGQHDQEFAHKLKAAGCDELCYSLESGNPKILNRMNKRISVNDFSIQKKILDNAGIKSATSIVLGYPEETVDTINETYSVCYENDILPSTGFLLPLPGSVIYDEILENGLITDEEQYLLTIGERQYLRINMTNIPDEDLYSIVKNNIIRICNKLKLDIDENHLICNMVLKKD
jgi:radical SAM superfamily enzyme YgiQ (UPF0313 family)